MKAKEYISEVKALQNLERASHSMRFFKTGKGEYGEGDIFWGLTVPQQRSLSAKHYKDLDLKELGTLMRHEVHEIRSSTLMMLVLRYQKLPGERDAIKELYLENLDYVNNWDLVDSSAHHILGNWCLEHGDEILFDLANREHLWSQRVAMIACAMHISKRKFETPLKIAELLLHHKHDLIHKAVGWMLREIGNRDLATERAFLDKHYSTMPRTMLRYSIERFEESLRQDYLKGRI